MPTFPAQLPDVQYKHTRAHLEILAASGQRLPRQSAFHSQE